MYGKFVCVCVCAVRSRPDLIQYCVTTLFYLNILFREFLPLFLPVCVPFWRLRLKIEWTLVDSFSFFFFCSFRTHFFLVPCIRIMWMYEAICHSTYIPVEPMLLQFFVVFFCWFALSIYSFNAFSISVRSFRPVPCAFLPQHFIHRICHFSPRPLYLLWYFLLVQPALHISYNVCSSRSVGRLNSIMCIILLSSPKLLSILTLLLIVSHVLSYLLPHVNTNGVLSAIHTRANYLLFGQSLKHAVASCNTIATTTNELPFRSLVNGVEINCSCLCF